MYLQDLQTNPLPTPGGIGGFDDLRKVDAFEIGTGNRAVKADQSGLWLGANKFADAQFSVNMAGDLIATSATISGVITAATIDIGGADATSFHVDINGNIWSGHANFASASFKVSNAGAMTISSLTVTGGTIIGTDGNTFTFRDSIGGTIYGQMGYLDSSTSVYIAGLNSAKVYILGGGGVQIHGADATDVALQAQANGVVTLKGTDSGGANSSGVYLYDYDVADFVEKKIILRTSKGYRSLYCVEAPEVWFMDFCVSKDSPDPLFMEVTEKPYHFIKCEDGEYQVWGKRKGLADKRFESKDEQEFRKNNEFWSTPLRMVK